MAERGRDAAAGPAGAVPATGLTPGEAAALAHPSRRSIAEALGTAEDGLTVAELAGRVGLHPNAIRQHLGVLQRAGIVVAAPSPPTGRRGRPSARYALAAPHAVTAVGHRELVRLLLELVRRAHSEEDDLEAFGWEQGWRLVAEGAGIDALVSWLAGLGFAPEEVTAEAERRAGRMDVRLRACPFKDAVLAEGGHLICALHRGLVRGSLERIDDRAELEVFEPKDPVTAGCRVLVAGIAGRREPSPPAPKDDPGPG